MFKRILIANRGEIACRVIKTARRMGISTVAVYSDADANALHVQMADEAVHIGGAASSDSYLAIDRVLDAIKSTGAEAVHPGYGFLSENARFADAVEAFGVVFIGPLGNAIAAMGDKIESKKLASVAGVNIVPGSLSELADADEAVKVASEIGYPVMIKASAGGGGKGMRIAHDETEAREGFRSAVNEARSSFGDERVFIEKFVVEPRHIEIQVLADSHGNTIYLGERECSIQRRHQKVIEEAPSPFLDEATRQEMGEQSVALAKAVDYRSAGTVEFIVDKNRNFYFLEMNTRLQVEHPVTECITGLDLVELMIRVAAGEELPLKQSDVKLEGWAMEARVYAEDPCRGFLPSTGRLVRYQAPPEDSGVRVDEGVNEGTDISMFYDPMIAKLVTYGSDRFQAIDRMISALNKYQIRGVSHNIDFLTTVMAHPRFREGRLSTGFIAEEFAEGFSGAVLTSATVTMLHAVVVAFEGAGSERNTSNGAQVQMARRASRMSITSGFVIHDGEARVPAKVITVDGGHDVVLDGKRHAVRGRSDPDVRLFDGTVDGNPIVVQVDRDGLGYRLRHGGAERHILVVPTRVSHLLDLMPVKLLPDMSKFLLAPMPGLLVSVTVSVGESVNAGQELAVVEAMKMENVMRAERNGTVFKVHASVGDSLAVDQPILEFE